MLRRPVFEEGKADKGHPVLDTSFRLNDHPPRRNKGRATMDLGEWLRSLGLERYEAAFRENEIDDTVLPSLTAEDLKDLGVTHVGHRRTLLDAIAVLRSDANTKTANSRRPFDNRQHPLRTLPSAAKSR